MCTIPPHHKKYQNIYSVMGFLFMKASKKKEDVFVGMQKISLKPGQCATSQREISEFTGIHASSVKRALENLAKFGEIIIEATAHHSLITLIDFKISREC